MPKSSSVKSNKSNKSSKAETEMTTTREPVEIEAPKVETVKEEISPALSAPIPDIDPLILQNDQNEVEESNDSVEKDSESNELLPDDPNNVPGSSDIRGVPIDNQTKNADVSKSNFSNMSINSRFPTAREISESPVTILKEMTVCFISLIVNAFLLYLFTQLYYGVTIPIAVEYVTRIGAVFVEVILLIANVITIMAMTDGYAAYFGSRLCSKQGFSLAVCGFQQANPFLKIQYCNQLSLNSTCRKTLSRLAIVYIFYEFLKILCIVSATGVYGKTFRADKGTVNCVIFGQDFDPVDRGWPSINVQAGISELIFGTYVGYVRSERADLSLTTAIMTPQIVGAVNDGDTIIGDGFTTDIFTNCSCTNGNTASDLTQFISDNELTSSQTLLNEYNKLNNLDGMASYIQEQPENNRTAVTTLFSGSKVCGGSNGTLLTVCTTVFNNHNHASIIVTYMTDGTPASIAGKESHVREITGPANLTWMTSALLNIHDGNAFSSYRLPNNFPGALTPLLWWTTPNLLSTDPSLLDAGVETYFAIVLRAGMQRTFSVKGNTCTRNVIAEGYSFVNMAKYAVGVALFIASVQLFITILAIAAFIPWFLSEAPIGPGSRIILDNVYFLSLINSSGYIQGFSELCNATTFTIWQAVDVVARIGESLTTRAEIVGHIVLDKPKVVRPLTNGKKYY